MVLITIALLLKLARVKLQIYQEMLIWVKIVDLYEILKSCSIMYREIMTFGDIKVEKHEFHYYKNLLSIDVDIDEMLTSNKVSFS